MEIKLNKEKITAEEVILKTTQEQSLELDYILPDYCPEIYKIIKCMAMPKIVSFCINGEKLCYEMNVCVRVLYCKEDSEEIFCCEQKLVYSKSVDNVKCSGNPYVTIIPCVDYVNCRAVNPRRIDVRGAISTEITIIDDHCCNVICDAFGNSLELKKEALNCVCDKISVSKMITVTEELELGISKPAIENIISADAVVVSVDKKVIANKIVAKGEINVTVIYTHIDEENAEACGVTQMCYTVPFSQIVELENADERYDCFVEAEVMQSEITAKADIDGKNKIILAELSVIIRACGYKTGICEIATDEYSTLYETTDEKCVVKVDNPPVEITATNTVKASVENGEEAIDCVYCVKCDVKGCKTFNNTEKSCIDVSAVGVYTVICLDGDKNRISLDKEEAFTFSIPCDEIYDNSIVTMKITPISCAYNLVSDNTVEIKVEIKACGKLINQYEAQAITDIYVNEESPKKKDSDVALKLYFASADENLWDIAKKYSTTVSSVTAENNIDDDIKSDTMLIIPII